MVLKVVDDIQADYFHYNDQPLVQFLTHSQKIRTEEFDEKRTHNFDKTKYRIALTDIGPNIRKLPVGVKASEEALQRARKMGYIIREGETFVRPFKKKTYKL